MGYVRGQQRAAVLLEVLAMRSSTDRGLDPEGFILPEVALCRITPPYLPVVDHLRERCRETFGDALHSLYLCGSLVKGTACPGVSDLDALAVLRFAPDAEHETLARGVAKAIEERHPFLVGATVGLYHHDDVVSEPQRYDMGFFVKCLCACIDGEDLAAHLPRYRPSAALARGTNGNFRLLLDDRRQRLADTTDPEAIAFVCRGIMRKIVRTGFTLVMPRYRGWTSDLERSAVVFATYYPEQRGAMHAALALARSPSADKRSVLAILDTLGEWLGEEYQRMIIGAG
jgi:uncharacterized protein